MKFRVESFETFRGDRKWRVLGPQSEIRGMYLDWHLALKVANQLANDNYWVERW